MKDTQGSSVKEAWVLCLILGLIMINFPFIHIFNTDQKIFGIPQLVLYFYLGWPVSILVIWLFARTLKEPASDQDRSEQNDEES